MLNANRVPGPDYNGRKTDYGCLYHMSCNPQVGQGLGVQEWVPSMWLWYVPLCTAPHATLPQLRHYQLPRTTACLLPIPSEILVCPVLQVVQQSGVRYSWGIRIQGYFAGSISGKNHDLSIMSEPPTWTKLATSIDAACAVCISDRIICHCYNWPIKLGWCTLDTSFCLCGAIIGCW